MSLALAAAVQAQGVVLSLKQLAMDDLTNGRLVVPFGREVEFAQGYYVISQQHTGSARAEHIMVFRRWLMEEAAIDINTKRS